MSESFDRALRGAARRGRAAGVCPDADVLAAYVDRSLTPDERATVEAHAADCERCQEHLALLGAVSIEPAAEAQPRSWLVRWGWLVPVATAVVVVAIWVRLPDRDQRFTMEERKQGAGSEPSLAPAPPDQPMRPETSADSDKEAADEAQAPRKPASPSAEPAAKEKVLGREAPNDRTSARLDALRQEAKADAAKPTETGQRRAVPEPVAPATRAAAAPATAPPAAPPAEQTFADRSRKVEIAGATSRDAAANIASPGRELKKESRAPAIVAVSPSERYRVAGSHIEQSADGVTWREIFADISLTFTAAACAGDGVCWFGTTTGRLERRSGGTFATSYLPERLPIAAIAAETGGRAAVTAADGRRFTTADAGQSWRLQ